MGQARLCGGMGEVSAVQTMHDKVGRYTISRLDKGLRQGPDLGRSPAQAVGVEVFADRVEPNQVDAAQGKHVGTGEPLQPILGVGGRDTIKARGVFRQRRVLAAPP